MFWKFIINLKESSKKQESAEAKGLILQFTKFEVIAIFVCLNGILNIVNCLLINLKSSTLKCTVLIYVTKKPILKLHEFKKLYKLFEQWGIIAQSANIPSTSNDDFLLNRMSQNSSRLIYDYVTIINIL